MKLSEIKSTSQKIEQGAWVRDLPNLPGVAVKVRGTFNSHYNRLLNKLRSERTPDQLLSEEAQEEIETRLLHETVLIDWDGIEDASYSPETARELLSDPDMAVFRRAVSFAANVVAREGHQTLERDAKN